MIGLDIGDKEGGGVKDNSSISDEVNGSTTY